MFLSRVNFKVKFSILLVPLVGTIAYFLSVILLTYYTSGDQIHYVKLYEEMSSLNYIESLAAAQLLVGSSEPVSIFLLWLGAYSGIDKVTWISLFNSFLVSALYLVLLRFRVGFLAKFLVLTNFYLYVLLTGAERLKFSYLFLVFSLLVFGSSRLVFLALALLSHFQTILLFPSLFLYSNYREFKRFSYFYVGKKFLAVIFLSLFFLILFFVLFGGGVFLKAQSYVSLDNNILDVIKPLGLVILFCLISKNSFRAFLSATPLILLVLFLGPDRVNMIIVTFVFFIALIEGRVNNPLFLAILFYFSLKTIGFISNIIIYGDGFYFAKP